MKYIAHRGYSKLYKDNSVEAIEGALACGYDGVEIDVQLCSTGELVLFHDVYDGDAFIGDLTVDQTRARGILTLDEVYARVPELKTTLVILDIKGNDLAIVNTLMRFYEGMSTENVYFCSFNRKIVYSLPPRVRRGSTFETVFHESEYDRLTAGLSAVIIHWTCLDFAFISYCKYKGIQVFTYTHKEDKEFEYMNKYAVDGIITNGV